MFHISSIKKVNLWRGIALPKKPVEIGLWTVLTVLTLFYLLERGFNRSLSHQRCQGALEKIGSQEIQRQFCRK